MSDIVLDVIAAEARNAGRGAAEYLLRNILNDQARSLDGLLEVIEKIIDDANTVARAFQMGEGNSSPTALGDALAEGVAKFLKGTKKEATREYSPAEKALGRRELFASLSIMDEAIRRSNEARLEELKEETKKKYLDDQEHASNDEILRLMSVPEYTRDCTSLPEGKGVVEEWRIRRKWRLEKALQWDRQWELRGRNREEVIREFEETELYHPVLDEELFLAAGRLELRTYALANGLSFEEASEEIPEEVLKSHPIFSVDPYLFWQWIMLRELAKDKKWGGQLTNDEMGPLANMMDPSHENEPYVQNPYLNIATLHLKFSQIPELIKVRPGDSREVQRNRRGIQQAFAQVYYDHSVRYLLSLDIRAHWYTRGKEDRKFGDMDLKTITRELSSFRKTRRKPLTVDKDVRASSEESYAAFNRQATSDNPSVTDGEKEQAIEKILEGYYAQLAYVGGAGSRLNVRGDVPEYVNAHEASLFYWTPLGQTPFRVDNQETLHWGGAALINYGTVIHRLVQDHPELVKKIIQKHLDEIFEAGDLGSGTLARLIAEADRYRDDPDQSEEARKAYEIRYRRLRRIQQLERLVEGAPAPDDNIGNHLAFLGSADFSNKQYSPRT